MRLDSFKETNGRAKIITKQDMAHIHIPFDLL